MKAAITVAFIGAAAAFILLTARVWSISSSRSALITVQSRNEKDKPAFSKALGSRLSIHKELVIPRDIAPAFHAATRDRRVRKALKARLTMLCDEGRSHPEYWALKTELDRLDGGEDDSDVVDNWATNQLSDMDWKGNDMSFGSDFSDLDSDTSTADLDATMDSSS